MQWRTQYVIGERIQYLASSKLSVGCYLHRFSVDKPIQPEMGCEKENWESQRSNGPILKIEEGPLYFKSPDLSSQYTLY
jgi:hypothetical protein